MNRKLLAILVVAMAFVILFASCGKKSEFDAKRDPDLAPWAEKPVEVAQKTKTLRFYTLTGYFYDGKTKGDSTLIVFPDGTTMLVDTGVTKYGQYIGRSLNALGIEHVDYLLITHAHDDHAFGVLKGTLLDYVSFGHCYYNGIHNDEWADQSLLENVMERNNIPYSVLTRGDELDIGGVHITVISPSADQVGTTTGTNAANPASIVMKLEYGETSCLMTGDMHDENEAEVIALYGTDFLDCDLMKIAHHGLKTSSTDEFLEAVTPQYAFCIGSGSVRDNLYTKLCILGAKTYMDTIDGYMRAVLDGKTVTFTCSKVRETTHYEAYEKAAEIKRQQLEAEAAGK